MSTITSTQQGAVDSLKGAWFMRASGPATKAAETLGFREGHPGRDDAIRAIIAVFDEGWEVGYDAALDAEGYPVDSPLRSNPTPTGVHCPQCKAVVPKVLTHYVGAVGHDTLPGDEIKPYWICQGTARSCRD